MQRSRDTTGEMMHSGLHFFGDELATLAGVS